jgi:uncharacterized protein YwgA
MTIQEEIKKWEEKLNKEKLKKELRDFEKEQKQKKKKLKQEYIKIKYEKPLAISKSICEGFNKLGKGFMKGIDEI